MTIEEFLRSGRLRVPEPWPARSPKGPDGPGMDALRYCVATARGTWPRKKLELKDLEELGKGGQ